MNDDHVRERETKKGTLNRYAWRDGVRSTARDKSRQQQHVASKRESVTHHSSNGIGMRGPKLRKSKKANKGGRNEDVGGKSGERGREIHQEMISTTLRKHFLDAITHFCKGSCPSVCRMRPCYYRTTHMNE